MPRLRSLGMRILFIDDGYTAESFSLSKAGAEPNRGGRASNYLRYQLGENMQFAIVIKRYLNGAVENWFFRCFVFSFH